MGTLCENNLVLVQSSSSADETKMGASREALKSTLPINQLALSKIFGI